MHLQETDYKTDVSQTAGRKCTQCMGKLENDKSGQHASRVACI